MGHSWLVVLVTLLASCLSPALATCGEDYYTGPKKISCWIANWKKGTCEQSTDYAACKALAQASYDDEYVCCNAIALTGRWNGLDGPQGICAHLEKGECTVNKKKEGSWKCTDRRKDSDTCWFPDYKQRTCLQHKDAGFCGKGGRTVYKTSQYCCDMISWGGIWNGKPEANGVCKDFCTQKSDETYTCTSGIKVGSSKGKSAESSGDCVCHTAEKGDTWNTIAADYGTTPYTIFQFNTKADPQGLPIQWKPYKICPAPGREAERFRPEGKEQKFRGCLDDSYIRPCSGYGGEDREKCFCSYKGDGVFQWPFAEGDCGKWIKCEGGKSVNMESCEDGEVVHEEPQEDGSVEARCVKAPKNFKCTVGCADHSCICRDLLLPTGLYKNPFDWDDRSGVKCDYASGTAQWFHGVAVCSIGKFNAKTGDCRSELTKKCEKKKSWSGCQAFYPPSDSGCGSDKRKLLAASLSWGTASDKTCNWWIGRPCVCPARNRSWSTSFGCSYQSCATKLRNPCRNGGSYSKQPATRTKDVCYCEFNGGCPYMFYRNCAFRW